MFNVLSDMVEVWAGLGGGQGARGFGGADRWYRYSHWLYDNPQGFEDQNILNVPDASILYTGSWYIG